MSIQKRLDELKDIPIKVHTYNKLEKEPEPKKSSKADVDKYTKSFHKIKPKDDSIEPEKIKTSDTFNRSEIISNIEKTLKKLNDTDLEKMGKMSSLLGRKYEK